MKKEHASGEAHFRTALHNAELKATSSRLALLRELERAERPVTVEELAGKLGKNAPDQATLYRALKELKDAGLVRQIDFQHGHAHYELDDQRDHHHLVCVKCERVEDFTGCNFASIVRKALENSRQFEKITQHSLELFGVCRSCGKKRA